ncbi:hypothetical protein Nepgr_005568 [Nepenthes gracilis]|uniref:Uncharacterized protein n=1 Tax=Nepenthes gracilis TaxID=150966 RepID=A0AAD3S3W1_NEPGR|nr:hypothetical protein Nepgr_005568 [Nepenthes gracilis]
MPTTTAPPLTYAAVEKGAENTQIRGTRWPQRTLLRLNPPVKQRLLPHAATHARPSPVAGVPPLANADHHCATSVCRRR